MHDGPRLLFLAFGFPPAAKSSTYRLREAANQFAERGWQVTVINAPATVWEADTGVDASLMDSVAPGIRLVEAPVAREDLETDIRRYSRARALEPGKWLTKHRKRSLRDFPEPLFGTWRSAIEAQVLDLHRESPFDLVLVSSVPYVLLAGALRLHREHGIPFAIDFRDGWSIDVIGGEVAFSTESDAGRWESAALEAAESLWVVNEPIAQHYRERYPELAGKVWVVRNGFDGASVPQSNGARVVSPPLRFGYLGTINFGAETLESVLSAWRAARQSHPLLAGATFEIRGYLGAGANRYSRPHLDVIQKFESDGVSYEGPVPKADVGRTYGAWDALVLILIGGGFVTSGKVYEYMASALPVVSAHESEHDATTLLREYPLWAGPTDMDHARLVATFARAAEMAVGAGPDDRAAARAHAWQYRRQDLMAPAVERLIQQVAPGGGK